SRRGFVHIRWDVVDLHVELAAGDKLSILPGYVRRVRRAPRLGRVDIRDRGGTARGVGPLPHALGALMQIVVRASIMFVFIFVIMRTMGRKELAQLSAFELILVIVMGDLIQQGVTQQDNSLTGAITAIST